MKIPYFCCIGAELKRYAKDFDFMNQVYLYKVPTDDSIEEVLAEDYFKAISDSVLQDDLVYIYEASEDTLHSCKFDKQNGHITAVPLASDETLTGAVTSIIHDNLTPNKVLISDENGKVAVSDLNESDIGNLVDKVQDIEEKIPDEASSTNQLADKNYLAQALNEKANVDMDNLTAKGKNIGLWCNNVANIITEIPQDIKLELSSGTLTLKAGSKVYVPNGVGVFDAVTVASDITIIPTGGSGTCMVCVNDTATSGNATSLSNCVSGASPTIPAYGLGYDTTTNIIQRTGAGESVVIAKASFPLAVVTQTNGVITSIDQVFNGFGYIGSTIFALPGVKGLMPSGRNADGTLNNTAFTVNNVITKTTSYDFGFDCNFMIRDGSTIDYVKNSFYLISEKTPSYKQYARLYQTTKNKCYYGEPSSWEPIQFVFCGTMTLDSNGKIIKFDSRLVFEAVDSTERDYVVDYQRPTAENNYTWYRKYKSGWVEQGGQFTATSVADGSGTAGNNIINLPIEMANNRYWYSANAQVGGSGWEYVNGVMLNARATTTLTLKVVAGTGDFPLYWEVKGMAA